MKPPPVTPEAEAAVLDALREVHRQLQLGAPDKFTLVQCSLSQTPFSDGTRFECPPCWWVEFDVKGTRVESSRTLGHAIELAVHDSDPVRKLRREAAQLLRNADILEGKHHEQNT